MRDLPTTTTALLGERSTKPIYLIDLAFPTLEHLSTNGDHTIDGVTYLGGNIGLSAARDWVSATLTLPPDPARVTTLIEGGWRGGEASIWLYPAVDYPQLIAPGYVAEGYGHQGFVADDPVLLMVANITAAAADGDAVRLDLAHKYRGTKWAPGIRLLPPISNYLPAPGTVIAWGGENWVLEAR